ncbi:MAG TPA: NDP-sugar synthase [Myxococcaceae bacterium]|nr:NDP-sugar synthase [Myxococcaceae bacterium]
MKALVLAAGLGTRLRPLTEVWPKPALPLLGQPLLRYALAILARAGVTGLGLNTHHLPEVMARVAKEEAARAAMSLSLFHEPAILGTGGGIRGMRRAVESEEAFLVWNGDVLFAPDLAPVVAEHRTRGADATMLLLPMPAGERYASVEVDADSAVRRVAGRGPGGPELVPWHFSGVHVLSPRIFAAFALEGAEDINRDVYPRLLAAGGRIHGAVRRAPWSDVGTAGRYLAAQRALLEGGFGDAFGPASPLERARKVDGSWLVEGARVEGTLRAPVLLDAGAVVERGARAGPNVYLGPGVRVPAGCSLEDAALLGGEVPPGGLRAAVLWAGGRLSA